jgi:hypothetical protein
MNGVMKQVASGAVKTFIVLFAVAAMVESTHLLDMATKQPDFTRSFGVCFAIGVLAAIALRRASGKPLGSPQAAPASTEG